VQTFNKSPFRYNDAYDAWVSFGAPEQDDENWDDFVASFDEDASDDEEEAEDE
jgi:hypothetical protein